MSYGTYVTTKTCGFLIDIIRRLVYLRVPLKLFQSDGSFFFLGVCLFFGFGFFLGGGGWGGVFPEFQSNLVRVFINTRTPFELRRLFTLSAT